MDETKHRTWRKTMQGMTRRTLLVGLLFPVSLLLLAAVLPAQPPPAEPVDDRADGVDVVRARLPAPLGHRDVQVIRRLKDGGGRLDWSSQGERIAFDQLGEDERRDIYLMDPEGYELSCVTCDNWEFRKMSLLNPSWHPSGDYLVVQAQASARKLDLGPADLATPHRGLHSELWLLTVDGRNLWQLTRSRERGSAVLDPHFSHEATQLLWSERTTNTSAPWGEWAIRVAEFRLRRGVPRLGRLETVQPFPEVRWLVAHGFSPNDRELLVSAATEPQERFSPTNVFRVALNGGEAVPLAGRRAHRDELVSYTPRGDRLVWASDQGIQPPTTRGRLPWRHDLWVRPVDGGTEERLTYFNDPKSDHFLGEALIDDLSWGPEGDQLAIHVVSAPRDGEIEESIYLLVLAESYRR